MAISTVITAPRVNRNDRHDGHRRDEGSFAPRRACSKAPTRRVGRKNSANGTQSCPDE